MVGSFELEDNCPDEDDPWKGMLCAMAFAVRATVHKTSQKTPAQSVFGRDMILNVNHVANWEHIRQKKLSLTKTMTEQTSLEFPTLTQWGTKFCQREELKTNMRPLMQAHAPS